MKNNPGPNNHQQSISNNSLQAASILGTPLNKLSTMLSKPGSPLSSNKIQVIQSAFTPSAIGLNAGFQKMINSPQNSITQLQSLQNLLGKRTQHQTLGTCINNTMLSQAVIGSGGTLPTGLQSSFQIPLLRSSPRVLINNLPQQTTTMTSQFTLPRHIEEVKQGEGKKITSKQDISKARQMDNPIQIQETQQKNNKTLKQQVEPQYAQSGKQSTAKKVRYNLSKQKSSHSSYSRDSSSNEDDYGDDYSSDEDRPPQMVEVSSEESLYEENDFDILTSDRFFEQMQVAFHAIGGGLGLPSKPLPDNLLTSAGCTTQPHKILQSLIGVNSLSKQGTIQTVKNFLNDHDIEGAQSSEPHHNEDGDDSSCISPFKSGQYETDPTTGLPKMPAYDKNLNYMDEYWNIYLQNQALLAQIDKIANDRNDLLMKTFKIESFYDQNLDRLQSERYSSGRKKHHRRCANDIERRYKCPYQKCEKFYGSEGSLNLHIKIKHGGGNKTDREKIAKSIVFAKANGINMSAESLLGELNLPPGAVERAAAQVGVKLDDEQIKKLEADLIQKQEIKKKKEIELMKLQMHQQQQNLQMNIDIPNNLSLSAKKSPIAPSRTHSDKPVQQLQNQGEQGCFKMPPPPHSIQMKKSASHFINAMSNSENDAMARNQNPQQALHSQALGETALLGNNSNNLLKKSSSAAFPKYNSLSAGKKEEEENTPLIEQLNIVAKSLSGGLPASASSLGSESSSKKARVQQQQAMSTRSSRRL